mgnify:CR=1 FL=1
MATKWQELNIDDEKLEIVIDDDKQELHSDDDDADSGSGKTKTEELEPEDEEDEIESETDTKEEKIRKIRKRPRHERREKALVAKLKNQSAELEHFKTEFEKIKTDIGAVKISNTVDATVADIMSKLSTTKAKLAKTKETGDFEGEAEALAELSMLALDLRVAQANKKTPVVETKAETKVEKQTQTEVPEAFLDWSDENPWFNDPADKDERKLRRHIQRKANELIESGEYAADDDDLYEEINDEAKKFIKRNKLKVEGFDAVEDEQEKKSKSSPVGGGREQFIQHAKDGSTRIHLTAAEKKTADRLGVDYKEYAKQKINMSNQTKSGYMDVF